MLWSDFKVMFLFVFWASPEAECTILCKYKLTLMFVLRKKPSGKKIYLEIPMPIRMDGTMKTKTKNYPANSNERDLGVHPFFS